MGWRVSGEVASCWKWFINEKSVFDKLFIDFEFGLV
jgi:hypothetical protein